MIRNTAGQFAKCHLVSKTDGSDVTSGTTTVYVTIDNGTQTAGSVGSGAATHKGNGEWVYAPSQAETNGASVSFTFVNTSAVNATKEYFPVNYDASGNFLLSPGTGSGQISLSSGAVLLQPVQSGVTIPAVTTLTNLPAVTTDWLTAAGVKADAVTKIQTGLATPTNITAGTITTTTNLTNAPANGDFTATMKSSITTAATAATPTAAAVTGAVGSVTGLIASDVGAIKTKTDSLTFTSAGKVDANTLAIGGTTQTAKDLGAFNVTAINTLASHDPGATLVKVADLGTVQSGDAYARIGAAGVGLTAITGVTLAASQPGVTIPTVTAITGLTASDVGAIKSTIGVAGAGLTSLGDTRISHLDADISSRLAPSGTLARVTLVDTTTTNSDMRGTNEAALASDWTATKAEYLDATISSRSTYSGGAVDSVTAPVTVGTNNDKTGYSLTTPAPTVDQILDEAVDGAITLRQAMMVILAHASGITSGGDTSEITFKSPDGAKNRITMTVSDATGDRSAVDFDLT